MKVLVLDDDIAMHTIMKQMLARIQGIELAGCFQEPEATLDFVRRQPIDIVFIDIQMGKENGLQIAKKLRALHSGMELVFVTSHKEYAFESFDAYPLDYIVKPVSLARLEQTISRAAQRKSQLPHAGREAVQPQLHVRALGGFDVRDALGGNVRWISSKSAELFAYLLLFRGQSVSKSRILEDVFPDMPLKNAETYLNTAVYQLRKALGGFGMKTIVQSSHEQYRLEIEGVEADFVRFEEGVADWERCSSTGVLDDAVALEQQYGGGLFGDKAYSWSLLESYRLEHLYLAFAKKLVRSLNERQRHQQAVFIVKRVLAIAELDEEANLLLLQTYHGLNDRLSLKTHLRHYASLYQQEFGLPLPPDLNRWTGDSSTFSD